ncbi:MAG: TatD family hydrolase [Clostridia bacterium]
MYIDTHTHLSCEDYEDIDSVVKNAMENDVKYLIVSCCSKKTIIEGLELLDKYKNIFLSIGFHPSEISSYSLNDLEWIESLVEHNKRIVAIGEIGLDYHYADNKDIIEKQKKLFIEQLNIAKRTHKPVIIHTRDATKDTIDILKKYDLKGVIHCFSGSIETAKEYIKQGYLLGIGGVVTFKNSKLSLVVSNIPLEKIVLETDSPYLTPEPFRGTKNESKNIPLIAEKVAQIKEEPISNVANITTQNAIRLFDLNI